MIAINDFSSRRGVLVPLLPKFHAIIKENAKRDRVANLEPPEHVITWTQKMRKVILNINRRFVVAMDGENLVGILFYRAENAGEKKIFIEDLQTAWAYRNNPQIIDGFLKKLEYDQNTKDATFYASERIKIDYDKELLASKGFKTVHEDGWERLGTFSQAAGAIKIRYNRGMS